MPDIFKNDPKDRKRRFLRGLNSLLGFDYSLLEEEIFLSASILEKRTSIVDLRNNLANFYGLEFTTEELSKIIYKKECIPRMTNKEFTEKYCPIIYKDRRKTNLNTIIGSSMKNGAIDSLEMDKALKYGLNGTQWCDVAEGPCSCGAWHE